MGESTYKMRVDYEEHKTECMAYQSELEKKVKAQSQTIDNLHAEINYLRNEEMHKMSQ